MRKEGTRLLADGTPYAAMRLLEAVNSEDDRTATVAAGLVLEHVRKVAETGDDDDQQGTLREEELTPDELAHLIECADHVQRYIALSEQRWADRQAGVIEGELAR
jgi:hypothetical protein